MRRARNCGRGQALPEDAPHRERSLEDVMMIEDLQRQNQVQQQQIDELTRYCSPGLFTGTVHRAIRFSEMSRNFFEDVSRAVQTLQRRGRARAHWEASKDWETRPIYDEYDEDEDEVGFSTCESVMSFIDHSMKPLTSYMDPFLLESQVSYMSNEYASCFFSSTIFLVLKSGNTEVKLQRRQNPKGKRSIGHGKIRGRIFSNKGRLMQEDSRETRQFVCWAETAQNCHFSDLGVSSEFSKPKRRSEQYSSLCHDVRWISAIRGRLEGQNSVFVFFGSFLQFLVFVLDLLVFSAYV
jgi:muconolactone delta-isomerase